MHIETPRLLLRDLVQADAGPLASIWADPEVTRFMGGPRDGAQVRASLVEDASTPKQLDIDLRPVIEKATGAVIGDCGLLEKDVDGKREIELVYVFAPDVWGRGYATEMAGAVKRYAFTELGLERLIALIDPENASSERVAVRIGMRYERETLRPGGKLMKVYVASKDEDAWAVGARGALSERRRGRTKDVPGFK